MAMVSKNFTKTNASNAIGAKVSVNVAVGVDASLIIQIKRSDGKCGSLVVSDDETLAAIAQASINTLVEQLVSVQSTADPAARARMSAQLESYLRDLEKACKG